ncbi:MAG: GspE/PulE family protein [Planctomycetota bacterium]|jgi:type II secretory ATPase GspE/PulE/Tfp pilus assembly ATPase PilB-like protein
MPVLLLTSIEYGSYISVFSLLIFLVSFFLWLLLITWVYSDAKAVGAKELFWTAVVFGTGGAAAVIWLILPFFIVGMLVYLIAVAAASLGYVTHRNALVMDSERVLTSEHIKGLFVNEQKKLDTLKGFLFVTANNNEVPTPESRTPDFFGYKTAYDLFNDASWRRADIVMFSPTPHDYSVAYYVDGAALKQPSIPKEQMEHFIHFVKSLADLDTNEKRKPQKGVFYIRQDKKDTQWQLTSAGSTAGEQLRLKQITKHDLMRLVDINLTAEQYEQLNKISELKQGLLIIAGPKKSGVTTTFYSLLRDHDAFINSINTLERKPSADLPNITQEVFSLGDTGITTYAKKLQAIIRMGPDIVGVADCQDAETAKVIAEAAKNGKMMYITLEADNVIKAVGKWMQLVGDRSLAIDPLLGISNQRLLRKLCDECKQAYEPNKEILRKFNISPEKAKVFYRPGKVQYDKHGKPRACENCQETGFVGRMAVFEMIMLDDQLKSSIKHAKSLSEIDAHFKSAKMLYLQDHALQKVISGLTAINEMVRIFSKKKKKPEQKS